MKINKLPILLVVLVVGCVTGKDRPGDGGTKRDVVVKKDTRRPNPDQRRLTDGKPASDRAVTKKDTGGAGKDMAMPPADRGAPSRQGWVMIKPGWFWMGAPTSEFCYKTNEVRHKVTLTRSFEMMQTEVSQGSFKQIVGYNPSHPNEARCGTSCPVASVSWNQAAYYCNLLSIKEKKQECYTCTGGKDVEKCSIAGAFAGAAGSIYQCKGYRLPTDAEWEYAYRAGSVTAWPAGAGNSSDCRDYSSAGLVAGLLGWYSGNSGGEVKSAKGRGAGRWGLYDMGGNIEEWIDDWYTADLGTTDQTDPWRKTRGANGNKVVRGGSFLTLPFTLRSAYRSSHDPSSTSTTQRTKGFRCVRSL